LIKIIFLNWWNPSWLVTKQNLENSILMMVF
jgi:hypothetical protein